MKDSWKLVISRCGVQGDMAENVVKLVLLVEMEELSGAIEEDNRRFPFRLMMLFLVGTVPLIPDRLSSNICCVTKQSLFHHHQW